MPQPGGPGAPATINHHIYLTRHGVVQGWTTADHGKPVAVVNQRSTFNHDVDSVVGFLRWGEPKLTHSVASWEKGAARIDYTFNWFYVDSQHDAYYVSGQDPIRAKGVEPQPADLGHRQRGVARLPAARRSTSTRPIRSRASSSAGTTSPRPASPPPTTSTATGRRTGRRCSSASSSTS